MTALNFPDSAISGAVYTANDKAWIYDGNSWKASSTGKTITKTMYITSDDVYDSLDNPIEVFPAVSNSIWILDTMLMYLPPNPSNVNGSGNNSKSLFLQYSTTPAGYYVDGFLWEENPVQLFQNGFDGLFNTAKPASEDGINLGSVISGSLVRAYTERRRYVINNIENSIGAYVTVGGSIALVADPRMLWREADTITITNPGTGYDNNWCTEAIRTTASGRASKVYVCGTATGGIIDEINFIENANASGILPEHLNEPLTLYSGNNDATIEVNTTSSYTPLSFVSPIIASFTATLYPVG
jgi:hypothetical protein